jgi:hypothetical protein
LNRLKRYYEEWKIKINAQKCESIFFTRKRKDVYLPGRCIKLDGVDIPWKSVVRYLGLIFDKNLTFGAHTNYVLAKIKNSTRLLYSLINRKSRLDRKNKLLIYKSVFRPIISYAAPAWSDCANCHLNKLQVAQNKCLKLFLDLPRFYSTELLHRENGIELINSHLTRLSNTFKTSCCFSDNLLITALHIKLNIVR